MIRLSLCLVQVLKLFPNFYSNTDFEDNIIAFNALINNSYFAHTGCEDKTPDCPAIASNGDCDEPDAKTLCPKSCGLCEDDSQGSSKNISSFYKLYKV